METNKFSKLENKLINAVNKITHERDYYYNCSINPNYKDYDFIPLKFKETLINDKETIILLNISTQLIYFEDILSIEEYIQKFIELFDIKKECIKIIEDNFNNGIFYYLYNTDKIKFEKYIINLTDVFEICIKIKKNKVNEMLIHYLKNKFNFLSDDYCKEFAINIINKQHD